MPFGNYEADEARELTRRLNQQLGEAEANLERAKALLNSAPFDAYRRYMSDGNDVDCAAVVEWQDAVARLVG
jgi:hypothetical protein